MRAEHEVAFSDFMAARWNALFRASYLITGDAHEAEDLLQSALAKTFVAWSGSGPRRTRTPTSGGS